MTSSLLMAKRAMPRAIFHLAEGALRGL
jgi:hypothetical protein